MSTITRSTRSRARKPSSASVSSALSKTTTPSQPRSKSTPKPQPSAPIVKKTATGGKTQQTQDVWCVCRGSDDSTPMIRCESCKDWFHFACINLSERDAEEIRIYVCDGCRARTGQSTVYAWEGPDAVEEFMGYNAQEAVLDGTNGVPPIMNGRGTKVEDEVTAIIDELGDEDDGAEEEASGDDYQEEEQHDSVVVRRGRGTQRITSSDEEEVHDDDDLSSHRVPSRRVQLKRKRGRENYTMQRKRPKKPLSEVGTDDDNDQEEGQRKRGTKTKANHDSMLDPTRKYCLGKLRDVLVPIFVQFASTRRSSDGRGTEESSAAELEEEQKKAEEDGVIYVKDLEECLFEIYGEPDKQGHKAAAGKYKDRFRMLSFNLSQPDRHLLRRSIGTHGLPALQLSKMSSVELANEQTKQQIEAANRESLEHSILTQRPMAARAKITHKGEEIIEDLVGDDIGRRIRDEEQREREREREREKEAREKVKMPAPPPPAPKELPFKGPQDILAQQHSAASRKAAQAQAQVQAQAQAQAQRSSPLVASPSLTEVPPEPSFKFDDLIAIDLPDDSPPRETTPPDPDVKVATSVSFPQDVKQDESIPSTASLPDPPAPETATRSASFDLNHVWSGAPSENSAQDPSGSPIPSSRAIDAHDPTNIDLDLGTVAHDEDFDMFLDQPDATSATPSPSGPEAERAVFEALPIVWSGKLHMPDAGKSPAVQARQVGGRHIDYNSAQWHILFPSHTPHQLKVDGRVPVKESAKYMTQNRMNITRELIIVALTPSADRADFDEVISFLINRDRHAVVHPWGPNPGPDAPGKELYLIPIMPHVPLPDYVEILDLVKFPKNRDDKILLGVFILNRGKFSERVPSGPLQPPAPAANPRPDITPAPSLGVPTSTNPSLAMASGTQATQQPPAIPPEIVSKLTTEQIESLLHSVLSGGLNQISTAQPQPPPPPAPGAFPPQFPPSLANLLPQQYPTVPYPSYSSAVAPVAPQYSPPPPQQSLAMPYGYTPPNLPASPPRDQDFRGPPSYGSGYGRPGRGEFDRVRGRGGGRHFGGGERSRGAHGNDFDRPRDSGWSGRGRGRGGSQQSQSPPRPW